ncbi:MAG: YggT family protein, partial [Myxococcota bacterium]|nr:YggT family protein [Myxococcota bacterium]
VQLVILALDVVTFIIIGDAVLSWIQAPTAVPRVWTRKLTEPLYAPIQAVVSPRITGGIDLSPIVVLVVLHLVQRSLIQASRGF